jgi:hypothetical protein
VKENYKQEIEKPIIEIDKPISEPAPISDE